MQGSATYELYREQPERLPYTTLNKHVDIIKINRCMCIEGLSCKVPPPMNYIGNNLNVSHIPHSTSTLTLLKLIGA